MISTEDAPKVPDANSCMAAVSVEGSISSAIVTMQPSLGHDPKPSKTRARSTPNHPNKLTNPIADNNVKPLKNEPLPTPIVIDRFLTYLRGYDKSKLNFLQDGFKQGFRLQYEGPRIFRDSRNLKSALDNMQILKDKIQKEIYHGRCFGPYHTPPFTNLQISPLGLVPKKEPNEFRVIHHLSFPEGSSINDGIAPENSTVVYQTIDQAIQLIKHYGPNSFLAKTDIESAFRLIPIHPDDYELLGFKIDDKFYFDRVLPMGCSISCRLFEAFSSAIHWILEHKFQVSGVVHVLDDFLFVGPPDSRKCLDDLNNFLSFCSDTSIPIKQSKTELPTTVLTFLGIELDSKAMVARLPLDKVEKMRALLDSFSRRQKVTLKELQSLIGLLNFACRVISPGRTFLRRLIDLTCGLTKPYHHKRLNKEARCDLAAWKIFLDSFNGTFMFLSDRWETSEQLRFYTDASNLGYGGFFQTSWMYGEWPLHWQSFHITVKEFFAIIVALELWGPSLTNRCIIFYCDNHAVVDIINKQTSKDKTLMKLVRRFVVTTLKLNILFTARHIPGKSNILSDHLSRLQVDSFHQLAPYMDTDPTPIPVQLMQL
ncbi:uncharacterized protein LOC110454687 isoform X1 [Mizuhopecten yessoensis]|uniref:uncharacterized protein LOC110446311 isoform X1 n=1 Tax=Mizuhopecten yessoensis TaxID=6573 RepID=UPI000B45D218|nr:uncharacterized protein LOC110446311 isoform X1 [Mizuhopecten yessoensis]XP_021356450.1 uncharacterized protein LOC110452327 isoform X1 [Mizuhopecten yessoensis]XP_021360012.1 uncharacterized protein LOC110454687 isoform X1 [Mizuhopecten yessoensis]